MTIKEVKALDNGNYKALKLVVSIFFQLISIPTLHWILYGIALLFHEPHLRMGSDGMDFYGLTLLYLTGFVIVTLPLLNIIQAYVIKNIWGSVLAHIGWFAFIVWFTKGDLVYRPYDYGLLLFCVGTTIVSKPIFSELIDFTVKKFKKGKL